jgi:hypothetical protein
MMIRSREVGHLWPSALILAGMVSLPFVAALFVGALIRRALASRQ